MAMKKNIGRSTSDVRRKPLTVNRSPLTVNGKLPTANALHKTLNVSRQTMFLTALIIIILDQATKVFTRYWLSLGQSFQLLPFFSITHTQNIGIAFGLFQFEALRWVLVLVALVVAIIIAFSRPEKQHQLAWGLIMGGALGNMIDRVVFGTVTDFIAFSFWPSFNVADSALTIGVILLVWHAFKKE